MCFKNKTTNVTEKTANVQHKKSHPGLYFQIIPVEGSEKVNGEDQKTYGEILHEIIISK